MHVVGVLLISLGILSFLIAGSFYYLYRTFEYNKTATDRVAASLTDVDHKEDVPVCGQRNPIIGGPIRVAMKIKNYSRGTYEYFVNKKRYTIHYAEHVTSRQMSRMVSVVYIKSFPKIAYIKTDMHTHHYDIYSIVAVLVGALFLISGFSVLL